MGTSGSKPVREISVGMRRLLVAAGVLVFLAGFQLFILTEQTDQYFAWTIQPPLIAAFLGAGYWSSCLLEFLSSRERVWARARLAVPAVFTFTTLTLAATLLHFDRFHFSSSQVFAQAAAWFWLAIYLVVPPTMLALWIRQMRAHGGDPQREASLPRAVQLILMLQSIFMLTVGGALFIMPSAAPLLWPWKLTPLTSRAVCAWLLGLGVFASHAAKENDFSRVKIGMVSYLMFGVLELLALGRYPPTVGWNQPIAWAYVLLLLTILGVGAYGTVRSKSRQWQ